MTHARARFALLAAVGVGAASALAPASAGAFASYYNCVNKASGQWCDGRANGSYDGQHSWDWNQATHPYGWPVDVCQRLINPSTGYVPAGTGCAEDYAHNYYGDVTCVCYDAEVRHLGSGPASVNGFADASW
jgi:hypothetical protein